MLERIKWHYMYYVQKNPPQTPDRDTQGKLIIVIASWVLWNGVEIDAN